MYSDTNLLWKITTYNNNREKNKKRKQNTQNTQWFSRFDSKPTFTDEDEEELSLLLKEITTLELSNPKVPITKKKKNLYFDQNLFLYIFLITGEDFI